MAVTLEGVFRIVDRASPTMRGIERQALKTDAAVASLGVTLDTIGSSKQQRRLDNTTRQVKTLGMEGDNAGRRLNSAGRVFDNVGVRVDNLGKRVERTTLKFGALGMLLKPAFFTAIGAGIGILVQAVGALSGGVIALIPKLTDLTGLAAGAGVTLVGLGLAVVTVKLATSGLSQALGGNARAFRKLTPEARAFVVTLRSYRGELRHLRQEAQQGLFGGIDKALPKLMKATPVVGQLVGGMGKTLGGLVNSFATSITSPGALSNLLAIGSAGTRAVGSIGQAIISVGGGLANLARAAIPFTDAVTKGFVKMGAAFGRWSQYQRDSGKFAAFLDRTRQSMHLLSSIARNLWVTLRNLGRDARPLGDILWHGIDKATRSWANLTSTVGSRQGLTKEFLSMGMALHEIMGLVGDLGKAIFRMGTQPQLAGTINSLRGLVPSLEKILNLLANTFGPPLARLLTSAGDLLSALSGSTGPLVMMVDLLAKAAEWIVDITKLVPGMGGALNVAVDAFGIGFLLQKIGLLERGWWRVAGAARAAAAAESVAGGGGVVGGRLGTGRLGSIASPLAFGFQSSRRGGRLVGGGFGGAARVGAFLGAGRLGSVIAGAGRFAGPVGIGLGAAGLATQFLPVSQQIKNVGMDTATGAGLGFLVGGPVGAGIGAGLGLGYGLLTSHGQDTLPGKVQGGINSQMLGQTSYPWDSALARMTAELAIYQNAQRRLAGDNSAAAQAERQSIALEIQSRQSLIAQLRVEAAQRQQARNVARGRSVATDLGHFFDFETKSGVSRAEALRRTDARGLGVLRRMRPGLGRTNLAKALLSFGGQIGRGDSAAAAVAAHERGIIGGVVPGALPITDPAKTFGPNAGAQIATRFRSAHFTEAAAERASASRTTLQNTAYRWFVSLGFSRARAAALVQAADGTGTMPGLPNNPFLSAVQQAITVKITAMLQGNTVAVPQANGKPKYVKPVAPTPVKPHRPLEVKAGGGRIGGGGLSDTVPVGWGNMAAPGELIVNRHQEALADRMLGGSGALSGIVRGMPRKHSAFMSGGYASGGVLTAGAYAGNPYGTGNEAMRTSALASILGFVPFGGGSSSSTLSLSGLSGSATTKTAGSSGGVDLQGLTGLPMSPPSGSNQALGKKMMMNLWPASQWPSLQALWNGESGWRSTALNPSSGAFGIPQSLPASKMASAGPDWRTNPATQIKWGLDYIHGRYGSPSSAYSAWLGRSPHWYQGGGRMSYAGAFKNGGSFLTNGPTGFVAGEGGQRERVTVTRPGQHAGGSPTLTIQSLVIQYAGSGEVKEMVLKEIESAWEEFNRELEAEAAR